MNVRSLMFSFAMAVVPAVAAAQAGVISGTVTDAGTGTGLAAVQVHISNASRSFFNIVLTGPGGAYVVTTPGAGTFYLWTYNEQGYINRFNGGVACPGLCRGPGGTPVDLPAGGTVSGRDFALARGGRIGGALRAAATSTPLQDARVEVYDSTGVLVSEGFPDEFGDYVTGAGLPTGTYYAHSLNGEGYLDEVFDNLPCARFCLGSDAVTNGAPIPVTAGATSTGRDFLLVRGGRITGRVTNAATGAGLAGVIIFAFDATGSFRNTGTSATGDYVLQGLEPGPWVLITANLAGFVHEVYNDIPCPLSCSFLTSPIVGDRIVVAAEATAAGIDFALSPGGGMSGVVTSGAGAPLAGVTVTAVHYPSYSSAAATTSASGTFTVTGLPTGTYYAHTSNALGLVNEIHGNIACPGNCSTTLASLGQAIAVTSGSIATGVNFSLDPGGRISGRVIDASTTLPIASSSVQVVDASGASATGAVTNASGEFISGAGLPPGSYFLYTNANSHVNEIYDGVPCTGSCLPAARASGAAVLVAAASTTAGRDFALDAGGRIAGTVAEAGTGRVQVGVSVEFYDAAGRLATTGFTDALGAFVTGVVPAGTYYGFTKSTTHANEIFGDVPCGGACSPSQAPSGTPIAVAAGAVASEVHFTLTARGGVPGPPLNLQPNSSALGLLLAWSPPATGGVPARYRLEAGLAPGSTALTFETVGPRFIATGIPPGVYYLRVRGINAAGVGAPSAEIVLTMSAEGGLPLAPFATVQMNGTRLLLRWTDQSGGGAPSSYVVEAGSASGLANIAVLPTSGRAFTYDPVPDGFYFLRVRAINASGSSPPSNEVMIVAGGVPSPPRAPSAPAASVSGSTVTLYWQAPPAPVTGYVIEAGSATGLSNLAVLPIGAVTTIGFPGIPPGTYYVRVRAVNALGRSVVSDEVVIVVG